jgi:hypothetical protein
VTLFGQYLPLKGGLINALGAIVTDGSKTQFDSEYPSDTISFTELCDRYGVSRKTGYKWIDRYQAEGPAGLADRSRQNCPQ